MQFTVSIYKGYTVVFCCNPLTFTVTIFINKPSLSASSILLLFKHQQNPVFLLPDLRGMPRSRYFGAGNPRLAALAKYSPQTCAGAGIKNRAHEFHIWLIVNDIF